jgi:dihydroneopterin aldolase
MRELNFTPSDMATLCNAVSAALQCYAVAQQTLVAKGHHDLAEAMGAKIAELVILHRLLHLAANVETPKPTQAPIAARSDKPRFVSGYFGLRKAIP